MYVYFIGLTCSRAISCYWQCYCDILWYCSVHQRHTDNNATSIFTHRICGWVKTNCNYSEVERVAHRSWVMQSWAKAKLQLQYTTDCVSISLLILVNCLSASSGWLCSQSCYYSYARLKWTWKSTHRFQELGHAVHSIAKPYPYIFFHYSCTLMWKGPGMGLCIYLPSLLYHPYLNCLHTFWHDIPTSFWIYLFPLYMFLIM